MSIVQVIDFSRNISDGWFDFDPVENKIVEGSVIFFEDLPDINVSNYFFLYGLAGNSSHLLVFGRKQSELGGCMVSAQGWNTYLDETQFTSKLSAILSGRVSIDSFVCAEGYFIASKGADIYVYSMPDLDLVRIIDTSVITTSTSIGKLVANSDGTKLTMVGGLGIMAADLTTGDVYTVNPPDDLSSPYFLTVDGVERIVAKYNSTSTLRSPAIYTTDLTFLSRDGEPQGLSTTVRGFDPASILSFTGGSVGALRYYPTYNTPSVYIEPSSPYGNGGNIIVDRGRGRLFYYVEDGTTDVFYLAGFNLQASPAVDTPMVQFPAGTTPQTTQGAAPTLTFSATAPLPGAFWTGFNKTVEYVE